MLSIIVDPGMIALNYCGCTITNGFSCETVCVATHHKRLCNKTVCAVHYHKRFSIRAVCDVFFFKKEKKVPASCGSGNRTRDLNVEG